MGRVKAGSLRLQEAAELLGLSYRQAKRVWARYRGGGAKALQHGNCGRISNRAHPEVFRRAVLGLVRRCYAHLDEHRLKKLLGVSSVRDPPEEFRQAVLV